VTKDYFLLVLQATMTPPPTLTRIDAFICFTFHLDLFAFMNFTNNCLLYMNFVNLTLVLEFGRLLSLLVTYVMIYFCFSSLV